MKKPLILADYYIDVEKVSFISDFDKSIVGNHDRTVHNFTIGIDGNKLLIENDNKEKLIELRNQLIHECGASLESKASGLMPS